MRPRRQAVQGQPGKRRAPRPSAAESLESRYRALKAAHRRLRAESRDKDRALETILAEHEQLRTLGDLVIGISHDANNILAALRLRLGILLKDTVCFTAQGPNLRALERILAEASRMLDRLQRFSRTEAPEMTAVDLEETVQAAIEIAQSGLRLRGAETGVQIHIRDELQPLPKVHGFADDLRHVLVNLLLNARDAMPGGGTITIRGRRDRELVVLAVEDEGHGIAPDILSKIFEPFFTTKGPRGTGMGLAIARNVMRKMGSTISARNRPEGGALFELRLRRFEQPRRRRAGRTRVERRAATL